MTRRQRSLLGLSNAPKEAGTLFPYTWWRKQMQFLKRVWEALRWRVGTTHSETSSSQSQARNQPMLSNGCLTSRCLHRLVSTYALFSVYLLYPVCFCKNKSSALTFPNTNPSLCRSIWMKIQRASAFRTQSSEKNLPRITKYSKKNMLWHMSSFYNNRGMSVNILTATITGNNRRTAVSMR
jgi:hypothetical protein